MTVSGLLNVKANPAAAASDSKPMSDSFQDSDALKRVSNSS